MLSTKFHSAIAISKMLSHSEKKIKKLNLGAGHKQFMIAQDCFFFFCIFVWFILLKNCIISIYAQMLSLLMCSAAIAFQKKKIKVAKT